MKGRLTSRGWVAGAVALALVAVGGVAGAREAEVEEAPYPVSTCPVSGQELGSMGDPVVKNYDGREVRFCCGLCPAKFEADEANYMAKLDEAIVEAQKDTYPLQICVVSKEALGGDMGDPFDHIHGNQLVRFCCKGCIKRFDADPAQYLSLLHDVRDGKREAPEAEGSRSKGEEG